MATITRRQFAQLAGAGAATLSLGGLLAACTNGDAGKGDAKPEEGVSAGTDTSKQVIVSMTPGSEPAAGFDPLVSWGCGEHVHEPLIQSTLIATTTEAGLPERPGHVLRGVGRRPDVDVRHPRRREVHRRPAAHGARRGLHPQRHPERRGVRVRPVHDEGGRGHGRHDGGNQPPQAVQRASVHACRHRHRARARLRRLLRRPSHRLGPLPAGAMGQGPAGHPQGEPGLLRRCAEDGARRGGVHGGGRLARGGAVWPGGRGLHGRDVRGQPADGLRPAQLQVGGLARHLAAVRACRRHEEGRRRRIRRRQRCDLRSGRAPGHQLRRGPREDDRQRAERLRHGGLQRGRRHAVVLGRHEVHDRRGKGEEAARRRRLGGRRGRHPREGRHARCAGPVLLRRRLRAPGHRRRVRQPDEGSSASR